MDRRAKRFHARVLPGTAAVMMKREVQRSEPGCTLWRVTDDNGTTHYEAQFGIHRLQQFEDEAAALDYYNLWSLEVRKEREQYSED